MTKPPNRPKIKKLKVTTDHSVGLYGDFNKTACICWGSVGALALKHFFNRRTIHPEDKIVFHDLDLTANPIPSVPNNLLKDKILKACDGDIDGGRGNDRKINFIQLMVEGENKQGVFFTFVIAHSRATTSATADWGKINSLDVTYPDGRTTKNVIVDNHLPENIQTVALYQLIEFDDISYDPVEEILALYYEKNPKDLTKLNPPKEAECGKISKDKLSQKVIKYYKKYFDIEIKKVTNHVIMAMWERTSLDSELEPPRKPIYMLKGGLCPTVSFIQPDPEDLDIGI